MYIAHIREDGTEQTVQEHLRGTSERCARFASAFGEEERGRMLGYAHDIGKCSDEFQKRLQGGRQRSIMQRLGRWNVPGGGRIWRRAVLWVITAGFRILEIHGWTTLVRPPVLAG